MPTSAAAIAVKPEPMYLKLSRRWRGVWARRAYLSPVAYTEYKRILRQQANLSGLTIEDRELLEP